MLSYDHAYHAGCAADVFKHTILSLILCRLNAKDAPYTVIDTHAGSGLYDTLDKRSEKTGEAKEGIKRLLQYTSKREVPEVMKAYIDIVAKYNTQALPLCDCALYPGSPLIELSLMRRGDNLILCELNNAHTQELKRNMAKENALPRLAIHHRDGYEGAAALTPPKTRRGLLFIDPSYEDVWEYNQTAKTIKCVLHKWREGIIALWYPVLEKRDADREEMLEAIKAAVSADKWMEARITAPHEGLAMKASGVLVINPPYKLDTQAELAARFIERALCALPR